MLENLKCLRIRPRLKKSDSELEALKNYRPVSNLPFLSKIIEKVVDRRHEEHLSANELHEQMQSSYRKCHSTETALLKLQSDIIGQLDNRHVVALILLDLSSAFDTIDHNVLLDRLHDVFWDRGEGARVAIFIPYREISDSNDQRSDFQSCTSEAWGPPRVRPWAEDVCNVHTAPR